MKHFSAGRGAQPWLALLLLLPAAAVRALPSFARQMNMQCIVCHTSFPELTAFGRQFKLSGYTLSADATELPPIAIMLQPSFTHTQASQPGGAAPGFSGNDNPALSQASVFYAGRLFGPYAGALFGRNGAKLADKFGILAQTTYDGGAKKWSWDNLEIRFSDTGSAGGRNLTYGAYVNDNPTMQDPWNSTPAWSFPFSSSHLAPTPAARTLIDGTLAQEVVGAGAYALVDNRLYADFGLYRTLGARFQKRVGVDPAGEDEIAGAAPYGRLALAGAAGAATWEIGTFGFAADIYPGRDRSAGHDRMVDLGLDSEYQVARGRSDITAMVSVIHEDQRRGASQALGGATNGSDRLWGSKLTIDFLYDKTYGLTGQLFAISGANDALAYPTSRTGSPNSDGYIAQLSYLPFNKGTGPAFWPRSNMKFMLQYVGYDRFDGSRRNIDGNGRTAANANTLYLEAWIAF